MEIKAFSKKFSVAVVCLSAILAIGFYGYHALKNSSPVIEVATSTQVTSMSNDTGIATTTYKYLNIIFQVVRDSEESSVLKIFQNDKLVFTKNDGDFYALGSPCPWDASTTNCSQGSSPTFGVDINGDGNKDFVFADYSGGTGDYISYDIFELSTGSSIKELTSLDPIAGGAIFKDLNSDGKLDVEFANTDFDSWHSSEVAATSGDGSIILSWDKLSQTYVPNLALMRKPPPSQADILKQVDFYTGTSSPGWHTTEQLPDGPEDVYSMPWSYAVNLVYSGNAAMAVTYLNQVWPAIASLSDPVERFSSEQDFKDQFLGQLKNSPYYEAILKLNGGKVF